MANLTLTSRTLLHNVLFAAFRPAVAHKSTKQLEPLNLSETEDAPATLIEDDGEAAEREEYIQYARNKSRLLPQHRKMLMGQKPYEEPQSWIHTTTKYQRMQFGRFGLASGIDARICFPTVAESDERTEFERIAYPKTIQQMIAENKKQKLAVAQVRRDREESITKKLDKLEQWTGEVNAKVAKKEADALAAKERKDRLVEEVRRQFGFKVDARDERFKELLAQKEKEDKKKQKEAKKKLKDEKMLAKLQELQSADKANAAAPE